MSVAQDVNPLTDTKLDQLCVNTIRTLSIDAVQQAKSGHPGTPMALAPLIYTIWNRVLRFDPQDPPARQQGAWPPRVPLGVRRRNHDRSAGTRSRHKRRHGNRGEVARQSLQPARLRYLRLQDLCRLRRWLPDGRRRVGSGVARGPPGPG